MEDLLQVGVITTTHGIRGEVKVYPTTDEPRRFEVLDSVLLDTGKELCQLDIERVRYFKNLVILKFKDVDNINDIEPYKGKSLYVPREMALPLGEDEYYIGDLIGMEVFLEDGSSFGTLKDVMETGANDVYVVSTDEGKEVLLPANDVYVIRTTEREVLVPAIKDCIKEVDVENNKMVIHLLKGL